jgi:hypothetical protein
MQLQFVLIGLRSYLATAAVELFLRNTSSGTQWNTLMDM